MQNRMQQVRHVARLSLDISFLQRLYRCLVPDSKVTNERTKSWLMNQIYNVLKLGHVELNNLLSLTHQDLFRRLVTKRYELEPFPLPSLETCIETVLAQKWCDKKYHKWTTLTPV
jgi:hypothetical protein